MATAEVHNVIGMVWRLAGHHATLTNVPKHERTRAFSGHRHHRHASGPAHSWNCGIPGAVGVVWPLIKKLMDVLPFTNTNGFRKPIGDLTKLCAAIPKEDTVPLASLRSDIIPAENRHVVGTGQADRPTASGNVKTIRRQISWATIERQISCRRRGLIGCSSGLLRLIDHVENRRLLTVGKQKQPPGIAL